jgi:hypothetical protein
MTAFLLAFALAIGQFSQSTTGELRLKVTDASELGLSARVELVSGINQVRETFDVDSSGVLVARRLPFGVYRLTVSREGFAPFVGTVDIRTALPVNSHVTLNVAPVTAEVIVTPSETLIDPARTTTNQRIGAETIGMRVTALPGRSLAELVNTEPGWLLEANGVLHPRGSEYQTQYIIDGLPLTDNRSPAFAPELEAGEAHSLNVLTAGYPAEYGRKLGGVIEVVTEAASRPGFHGSVAGSIGSFNTKAGDAAAGYSGSGTSLIVTGGAAGTDRYLDPPVEENYTNRGTTSHAAVHVEHDLSDADRFGVIARYGENQFLVPNEQIQQQAGQRQTRAGHETSAQFSYQHVFSADGLADIRGIVRDLTASLASNDAATPIIAQQSRGLRDLYVKASAAKHTGIHEWKLGADAVFGSVNEQFAYRITNRRAFDRDTPRVFSFEDRRDDREQSVFIQDRIQTGRWTVSAGLRWDHYQLAVDETAISPRLSVAWAATPDLVLRASYDRAFQTPAVENLLLASSPSVDVLNDNVIRLPVRPSRGNFYEAAVSKALLGVARVDATYFERRMTDFADDDVLLNTGVSFPIAFRQATIRGAELKIDLPHWHRVSGSASYALQKGVGSLPVTGGLLLGDEAASALASSGEFSITQDQRHTIRSRVSYQFSRWMWGALATSYDSGLPVEFVGDRDQALAQYGSRIVDHVDFGNGRVRPSFTLDLSGGLTMLESHVGKISIQVDVRNLTDRLNVINFAGVFSGTAVAAPRSAAVRLRADF